MAKIIALSGDVGWEITAKDIRAELKSANGGDVEFHINSPGGFVSEGIEIFNIIRAYEGHTTGVITGVAASMASYLILACNKVVAYDNAIYMIHNPWTFAIGDYNDMQKAFDMLKGMAGLLAKAYAAKAESALDKIKSLMDNETFFFGDEILNAGFVDEMISESADAGDADGKTSAIITAKASIETCLNRMRASDAVNSELEKAVAYVDGMSLLTGKQAESDVEPVASEVDIIKPAGAGKNEQEDRDMTFAEYLVANPAAKVEYDAAIATARTEGEASAHAEIAARVEKVSPVMASPDYSKEVKAFGAEVIAGKKTVDGFEAIVFMEDQRIEAAKEAAAKGEQSDETLANGGVDANAAKAKANFDKLKNIAKGQGG